MTAQPTLLMSRPMRALIVTLGLWVCVRAALLWSETGSANLSPPVTPAQAVPAIVTLALPLMPPLAQTPIHFVSPISAVRAIAPVLRSADTPHRSEATNANSWHLRPSFRAAIASGVEAIASGPVAMDSNEHLFPAPLQQSAALLVDTGGTPKSRDRLSFSAWTLVRPQFATRSLAPGAELGGSQAGLRVYAPIGHGITLTGQANTPLGRSTGSEASLGIALRIPHLTLLAERRIAITAGGRNDFAFTAAGGVDSVRLPAGARLDSYLQAGMVGRDGFIDGAVRIERTIAELPGISLSGGAGTWGGIQPGVSRIDIGPQLVARLRIGQQAMRISAEWRQRVAGEASPASGPALSVGADF